jgi:transposase
MKTATKGNGIEGLASTLYVAFELSKATWQLAMAVGPGQKPRRVGLSGGDFRRVLEEICKAKKRFGLAPEIRVVSCYEAGRDGFWLHRLLAGAGVESLVVDAGSLRRRSGKRHRKTDRLDVLTLLGDLMRWDGGDHAIWSVVRVPSAATEDLRRLDRERKTLVRERTAHRNRVRGLLVSQGVDLASWRVLRSEGPSCLRTWEGQSLGEELSAQLTRELQRVQLVEEQLKQLRTRQKTLLEESPERHARTLETVTRLEQLSGIGEAGSWTLATELYWRDFRNRKQVGGYLGLGGTPYASGEMDRDLGIGKDGPSRLRAVLVEQAWAWVRCQPESKITLWFHSHFGPQVKRSRRRGIVAVARKLAVALWRYLAYGEIPEGARLKPAAA